MKVSRSWLTLALFPALAVALIAVPILLFWNELPNPMATHWDLGGTPNGSMPPALLLLILAGLAVAIWWGVYRAVQRTPYEAPSFVAGLFAVETLLVAVTWMSVFANRGESSWEMASGVGLMQILLALVPAILFGYLGWIISGGSSVERTPEPEATPALGIAAPETAIWSSRGTGRILQLAGAVLIVLGLAAWGWATLLLIALGLLVLVFAQVRVTVSQLGVVVGLGWLGVPSWTVPMGAISQAEVETVNAMAYGGWGYRLRPGVRAIVTRGGEALRLVRPDKADLVLTVDDAATGAGLINSMLGVSSP